jgi:predicted GIY-YIG superfamily endonuclease
MVNIYILELEGGKYYVGKTNNTFKRFNQHTNHGGAKWTKKHPPVDLYDFHRGMKDADENRITIQMMREFGVKNVRGGSWTKVDMTDQEIGKLERKITQGKRRNPRSSQKKGCNRCGRTSHIAKSCYARYHANGKSLQRKSRVSEQEVAIFAQHFAQRRQQILEEKTTEVDKEQIEAEIKIVEDLKNKSDEERIEVMEILSEEERVDTNLTLFDEVMKPFRMLLKETEDVAKSVVNATKKVEKFGKKIGKSLKKNLGLK